MPRILRTLQALAAMVAIGLLLGARPDAAQQPPSLTRLQSVEELKSWFNAGVGHPRLILLLSPT